MRTQSINPCAGMQAGMCQHSLSVMAKLPPNSASRRLHWLWCKDWTFCWRLLTVTTRQTSAVLAGSKGVVHVWCWCWCCCCSRSLSTDPPLPAVLGGIRVGAVDVHTVASLHLCWSYPVPLERCAGLLVAALVCAPLDPDSTPPLLLQWPPHWLPPPALRLSVTDR